MFALEWEPLPGLPMFQACCCCLLAQQEWILCCDRNPAFYCRRLNVERRNVTLTVKKLTVLRHLGELFE